MITQSFNLNVIPESSPVVVHCDQYDTGEGRLVISLFDDSVAYTPEAGATAILQGTKPDGHSFIYSASISGNVVTADLTQQMSACAGHVRCQVVITETDGRTGTFIFILDVQRSALPDEADLSETDISMIEEAVEEAQQAVSDAEDAVEDAEAWAVGERGGVPVTSGDETYDNNAKYWALIAQTYAQGALHYRGSIAFANIPTTSLTQGDMYNITDDFTTDSRFAEGAGIKCPAGTNIAWNGSKWDLLAVVKVSSLNDLGDVSLSTLTNNDGLFYNATTQKFENKPVPLPDMTSSVKGIGKPDGKTAEVNNGTFSALGVSIPAEVNSGGTQYGSDWLYYAGTTEVITPSTKQNYRVTDNGTTKLYYWTGSAYAELAGGGGVSGDYMGLYGMTEIQSSDGQGTTLLDLDQFTSVGNYYCNGKAYISTPHYLEIGLNTTSSGTHYNAKFLLYVRTLPGSWLMQDLYLIHATNVKRVIHYQRHAYYENSAWTFGLWRANVDTGSISPDSSPYSLGNGMYNVLVNNIADGDVLTRVSGKWSNKPIGEATGLASINATGSTNTTGSTITAGTYFYLNGVLVRAKADIANGATFTLNTNYEVVTAGALNGVRTFEFDVTNVAVSTAWGSSYSSSNQRYDTGIDLTGKKIFAHFVPSGFYGALILGMETSDTSKVCIEYIRFTSQTINGKLYVMVTD